MIWVEGMQTKNPCPDLHNSSGAVFREPGSVSIFHFTPKKAGYTNSQPDLTVELHLRENRIRIWIPDLGLQIFWMFDSKTASTGPGTHLERCGSKFCVGWWSGHLHSSHMDPIGEKTVPYMVNSGRWVLP